MPPLPRAVAQTRLAVRRALSDLDPGRMVIAACSGGPDSMALAAATAFVAPRLGLRAGFATIDHGLQEGSAARAAEFAEWSRHQGFDPVEIITVEVDPSDGGPENAARSVRYAALDDAAERHDAAAVLLGHTRDDQAETVLLALARGGGPRGISGMPERRGHYRRPLLDLPREVLTKACAEQDLPTWDDPHNADPAYRRSALRALMPALTEVLGPGLSANLARTARLVADDNRVLNGLAARLTARAAGSDASLDVAALAGQPRALRTRVLHTWARLLGVPGSGLNHGHVSELDRLITDWHGQGPVQLPGSREVRRVGTRLVGGPVL
ncbi:tRNA(Ile)-lysidine synthase [Actinorhabdospora filicis]|uniref:tRNA(Ile)-lysidine synthase n=1 Tax=Actinorhabdospora filicis TaxID=1785913 RepID=A0A9W6W2N2_9ACTN|nr:tRNA lysidine(34) synthetase TilS [Actinorhabdospora filicis]GLZ77197.1 tRNA(Ile)-lysidine synthase [Actinorhabdospora filicis]